MLFFSFPLQKKSSGYKMKCFLRFWFLASIVVFSVLFLLSYMNDGPSSISGLISLSSPGLWPKPRKKNLDKRFAIVTQGCRIPYFDPFDSSLVQDQFQGNHSGTNCSQFPRHISIDPIQNSIFFDDVTIRKLDLRTCEWQLLIREDKSDDSWRWTHPVKFTPGEKVRIPGEFAFVQCWNRDGQSVVQNFAVFGFADEAKMSVKRRSLRRSLRRHLTDIGADESFNVFLIGIDSVSRNNLVRNFPETREFLFRYLDPIEYFGYNKVAVNTQVNLLPLLTGKFLEDLPREKNRTSWPFDNYPFVWKNFSQRGYWTLFGEDSLDIHTFNNYDAAGFRDRPTDHYLRPFLLAVDSFTHQWNPECMNCRRQTCDECRKRCFSHQTQDRWLYEWFLNAIQSHRDDRLFAMIWSNVWTHADISSGRNLDGSTKRLFKTLHEGGFLRDSFIFFLSDHGFRFSPMRQTRAGKYEDNLPMMYVILPEKLRGGGGGGGGGGKYKEEIKNLKRNSKRLTTHFDLYETLLDLADFGGRRRKKRTEGFKFRHSLFDPIPLNRTCQDANIKPLFCTCQSLKEVSVNDRVVVKVAHFIVKQLNKYLELHKNICAQLSLHEIKSAYIEESSESYPKVDYKETFAAKTFVVVSETVPGRALFEGTVHVRENGKNNRHAAAAADAATASDLALTLIGDVVRINLYGNSSHCVTEKNLLNYCYC